MNKILLIIFLTLFWSITNYASDLTEPNEIFEAIHEIKTKGSYKGKTGYIMRKNNEKNYSKFPIKLPDNSAPIVSDYKSKWGSCSSDGKISYNWRIIMSPHRVVDYIVIHELCHMLEYNHSKDFWRHVFNNCKDYRECRH